MDHPQRPVRDHVAALDRLSRDFTRLYARAARPERALIEQLQYAVPLVCRAVDGGADIGRLCVHQKPPPAAGWRHRLLRCWPICRSSLCCHTSIASTEAHRGNCRCG